MVISWMYRNLLPHEGIYGQNYNENPPSYAFTCCEKSTNNQKLIRTLSSHNLGDIS